MNPIDTLQVLIEADYSGLETSMKQGLSKIYQFVDNANGASINWTKILSGTMTPALIATIASTFALSIEQALQFQNAMQGASLSTSNSFATNSAGMTNSIYDLSAKTGQSASDIATAMGVVGQVFKDTATAEGVLNVVSQEAFIRHQNIVDVANQLVPLFQQWGVTDVPTASDAMATLNDSVKNGTINFDDLVTGLTDAGIALRGYTDLSSAAAQTELVSASPGMDAKSALQGLAATASAIENPLGQAAILLGNMSDIVKNGGMVGAFADIATKIQNAGAIANQLYGAIGLDQQSVQHFKEASVPDIEAVAAAAAVLIQKHESLSQQVLDNTTEMDKLKEAWATVVATLEKTVAPAGISALTNMLSALAFALDLVKEPLKTFEDTWAGLKDEGAGGFFEELSSKFASLDNALTLGGYDAFVKAGNAQSGLHFGSSGDAAATSPAAPANNNTTYNIGQITLSGNAGAGQKVGSLLPGLSPSVLPRSQ